MSLSERSWPLLPAIASGQGGCACCPPKPITASMNQMPHPGFGGLVLTRDGETPPEWWTFSDEIVDVEGFYVERRGEGVVFGEIEEAAVDDPDHDWRLRIDGPMAGYVYQRQGPETWVLVEKDQGFA